MLHLNADYLHAAIHEPERVLNLAQEKLADLDYDTMIGSGLSGALVLPMLARGLNKHFAVVRKPDNTHSSQRIEGTIGARWVFIDDLVSSGATLKRVQDTVQQVSGFHNHTTEYVGAFLYYLGKFRAPGEERS